jgi:hypothetical protein
MMPPGVHIPPPRLPTDTRSDSMTAVDIIICILIPCIGLIIGLIKSGTDRGKSMIKLSIVCWIVWAVIGGCRMRSTWHRQDGSSLEHKRTVVAKADLFGGDCQWRRI